MNAFKVCVGLLCGLIASAAQAADVAIPDALKSWQGWALHGEEFRSCPFFANRQSEQLAQSANEFVCAWPERLRLDLNARGGEFAQRWQVFAESWIVLPGNNEHWPRNVRLNGASAPVTMRGGVPHLRLPAGNYTVSGSFQWSARPEQLAIPAQTGIVDLTVDGRAVAQPERPDGAVWLGKRRTEQQAQQLSMQVYRLVQDDVPAMLTTHIRLQVSGEAREEVLGKVLPDRFVPMALNSVLPARIEADGALRVQLRPGQWSIVIAARAPAVAAEFKAPISERVPEEIWSYQSNDRLRVTAVEGVESIDPAQANVPGEWQQLPAYRMNADATLRVMERSRGLENQDANQLQLHRQLWLDFEQGGYTVVDSITGTMRQGWRLDMAEPFRVMSARVDQDNLLVTTGAGAELSGVELRQPNLNLQTAGRLSQAGGRMSATGWQTRFANVSGQLNLPPGHHLVAALGDVDAPDSWTARWRLLDFFIVLIVAVSAWKLRSVAFGALALAALVLNHQEQSALAWLMINLLIAVALAKVAPIGKLQTITKWYRNGSLALIVLAFVPFAIDQVRLAIYPQLEVTYGGWVLTAAKEYAPAPAAEAPMETQAMLEKPLAVAPAPEGRDAFEGGRARSFSKVASQMVTQRYAPGTVVQAGPGVPNWSYNSYRYSWSGPVDVNENVRFVIASPVWMFLWRVIGVTLLGAFIVGIAQLALQNVRFGSLKTSFLKSGAAGALCAFLILSNSQRADAQIPDAALLTELRARLTQPPQCAPNCAETLSAQVSVTADRLDMTLEVAALENVAMPIPVAVGRWEPESISVDGQSAGALYRDPQHTYWVALKSGARTLRMSGRLAAAESIQLVFPQKPHAISASGSGWEVSGVSDGRLLTNALELVRQRTTTSDRLSASTQFAPFVRVRRYVRFDLDWSVITVVERIAPEKGAFTVEIPLLKDESVLTAGLTPRDKDGVRVVQVGLTGGEREVSWNSSLPRAAAMELAMGASNDRTETWSFSVSPIWNVRFAGVPQVAPFDDGSGGVWTFDYFPREGESLKLDIVRPEAAGSQTLAIDSTSLTSVVGRRSTDSTLQLSYRSTQGGRHVIGLPLDAQVMSVIADGAPVPVRPQDGELPLSLLPGSHTIDIRWQSDEGASFRTRSPALDLRTSSSNVTTQIDIGGERWVLLARGQGVGPAILYWGELIVFIVIAVLLGRYTTSPLRTHDWLLLGLGLSTFSWSVLLIFAVWIFAMRWRSTSKLEVSHAHFNLRQLGLGALSLIAIGGLVSAIPSGLLRQPDMSVRSPTGGYSWFVDQTHGVLPQVSLFSVPLIVYKVAILLWALWLSFALLRWLPWGWQAFSANGIWRGNVARRQEPA